jgi:hypothetical protein
VSPVSVSLASVSGVRCFSIPDFKDRQVPFATNRRMQRNLGPVVCCRPEARAINHVTYAPRFDAQIRVDQRTSHINYFSEYNWNYLTLTDEHKMEVNR